MHHFFPNDARISYSNYYQNLYGSLTASFLKNDKPFAFAIFRIKAILHLYDIESKFNYDPKLNFPELEKSIKNN